MIFEFKETKVHLPDTWDNLKILSEIIGSIKSTYVIGPQDIGGKSTDLSIPKTERETHKESTIHGLVQNFCLTKLPGEQFNIEDIRSGINAKGTRDRIEISTAMSHMRKSGKINIIKLCRGTYKIGEK